MATVSRSHAAPHRVPPAAQAQRLGEAIARIEHLLAQGDLPLAQPAPGHDAGAAAHEGSADEASVTLSTDAAAFPHASAHPIGISVCRFDPQPGDAHAAFKLALIEQAVAAVERATHALLGRPATAPAAFQPELYDRIALALRDDPERADYLRLANAIENALAALPGAAAGQGKGSDFSDTRLRSLLMGRLRSGP